jgi:hypothetical protein
LMSSSSIADFGNTFLLPKLPGRSANTASAAAPSL